MRSQSRSQSKSPSRSNQFTGDRGNRGQKSFNQPPPNSKVYVTFLPEDIDEKQLKEVFEECGSVTNVSLKKKDDGFIFAHVAFRTVDEGKNAVQNLNKRKIGAKQIKVQFSKEMNRGDSSDNRGGRDRSNERQDRGDRPRRGGGDFNRESDTRRRFEGDSGFDNRERSGRGRGRGGFRDGGQRNAGNRQGGFTRNQGPRGPMKCFKCQGQGHMARDCTGGQGDHRKQGFSNDFKGGKSMKSTDKMCQEGFTDY